MQIRPHSAISRSRHKDTRRAGRFIHLERLEGRELLTTYSVGPGQTYSSIGAVPWTSVAPGDTVAIHWQAAGYHEKLLISESGTADEPINIIGVPGPQGQQPVIDGENATTSSQFHYDYSPLQEDSLVLVQRSADQSSSYKPSFINISGLEFKDAYQAYTFTDAAGATESYSAFAAAIWVEGANNVTIQNDTIDNSGNGLFALSNENGEADTTRNLMVEGNYIYGNGVPGSELEHNVYTESVGITFQYNDFGPLRAGADGNDLKDRSAGTVIRYNYFSPGGHILDLVDAEDSSIVASDPSYRNTYVYGNILNDTGSDVTSEIVHFGGDSGDPANYRPHLEFYDNTVVSAQNQSNSWRTIMFILDTNSQSVNAYDNIFYGGPATAGATPTYFEFMQTEGVATFGANWVSPGWLPSYDGQTFDGTITGTNNFYTTATNNPGFVNLAGSDYELAAGSSAIGRAVAINSGDPAVTEQYVAPVSETTRSDVADFGAYASTSSAVIPTVISTSPTSGATGTATSTSIVANFNEAIASGITFTLTGPSGAVAATLTTSSTTAKLVPNAKLAASTTYTATVSGAKDAAGDVMASPYSWSFTTAAPVVIPTVISTSPTSGATGTATSTSIVANFNEAIASSITFTLTGPSGAVAATLTTSSTTAKLVPNAKLAASTTYTATVSGAEDAAGDVMASPYSWSFTTAASVVIPTVISTSPTSGATGTATSTSIVANFNEAIASGITFTLTGPSGAVAATLTTSSTTANLVPTAKLAASTTYTATISGAEDAAGDVMTSPYSWSFTTAAPVVVTPPVTTGGSLWPNPITPALASANDDSSVELGVRFSSSTAGFITGIDFYKGTTNTGTHVGHLWTSSGQLLATATFSDETASGWQKVTFATPVPIAANTTYVASYLAPGGNYAFTAHYFAQPYTSSPLTAPANAGVFVYGKQGGFPTGSYEGANYWVDVNFQATAVKQPVAPIIPTVISTSPTSGATGTATSTSIVANFNEAIASGLTFTLTGPSGAVAATLTTSSTTAKLVPTAKLAASTTYTATISGAEDAAGDVMASPYSWSFTTAAPVVVTSPVRPPVTTGGSLWPNPITPALASANDDSSVELGVRFSSSTAGFITGIDFYKGTTNTGTHVGHLWTSSGQLLATATFSDETASGWQKVTFATPVPIAANTTYVASYLAPGGNYAFTAHYFAQPYTSSPLTAPANAGVFVYGKQGGFPTGSYEGANYWVDVNFQATAVKQPVAPTNLGSAITSSNPSGSNLASTARASSVTTSQPLTTSTSSTTAEAWLATIPLNAPTSSTTTEVENFDAPVSVITSDSTEGTSGSMKRHNPFAF